MSIVFKILTSAFVLLGYLGVLTDALPCWHNYNNSVFSYALCTDSMSQESAKGNCTERNMTLAVLSDPEAFNYWLSYMRANLTNNNVWIGAKCTNANSCGSFVWDQGGPVNKSYLATENMTCCGCVLLNATKVSSLDCSQPRGFMCQRKLDVPTTTTVSDTTSVATTTEDVTPSPAPSTEPDATSDATTNEDVTPSPAPSTVSDATSDATTTEHVTPSPATSAVPDATSDATTTEYVTTSHTTSATAWMSSPSTTTAAVAGNSSLDCWCGCTHIEIPVNKTDRDALAASESEKIKTELLLDIETLSKTVRRKTSAKDDRPSAQNIGYTGVAMLVTAALLIVLMDVNYVIRSVHGVAVKLKGKST